MLERIKVSVALIQEMYGRIIPEFPSPNIPQQNGVVERRFPTLKMRASAMMMDANLSMDAKRRLWGDAGMMANVMENITLCYRNIVFLFNNHVVATQSYMVMELKNSS